MVSCHKNLCNKSGLEYDKKLIFDVLFLFVYFKLYLDGSDKKINNKIKLI